MQHSKDLDDVANSSSEMSMSSQNSSHSCSSDEVPNEEEDKQVHESTPWEVGFLSHEEQQATAVFQTLKMSYEQRRRRLLSQRRLGQPETAWVRDSQVFLLRPEHLAEDDALLLQTFSNSTFFEQLLETIKSSRLTCNSLEDTAIMENIFHKANPLFHQKYAILVKPNQPDGVDLLVPGSDSSSRLARLDEYIDEDPTAQVMKKGWKPVFFINPEISEKSARPTSKRTRSMEGRQQKSKKAKSASVSLVAQTMQQWEKHLEAELAVEGETLDSFRQGKSKTNHIEKEQFQRRAQWNEFLRDKALEDQQRELAMKRAIRRGEVDP